MVQLLLLNCADSSGMPKINVYFQSVFFNLELIRKEKYRSQKLQKKKKKKIKNESSIREVKKEKVIKIYWFASFKFF